MGQNLTEHAQQMSSLTKQLQSIIGTSTGSAHAFNFSLLQEWPWVPMALGANGRGLKEGNVHPNMLYFLTKCGQGNKERYFGRLVRI
jgi:hypothetical protein